VNQAGSDVMIPAFMAAYSGKDASKVNLDPFPGIKSILPNWRVTYDGLSRIPAVKKIFKSLTLTHAYQCTYSVGSFSSYTDWITIGEGLGFTADALTGNPIPNSPYNISSVSITEKFAPLIGVNATLKNDLTFNMEYRDSRTLALNISSLQLVETLQKSFVIGASYKIANFNSVLKIKKKQQGVNNDLTLNFNLQLNNNTALIRKIDVNTTQATSGTRTLGINFSANYVMSKRITLGAFFDHQVNTPLVSTTSYPTTNTNYGISVNVSLAK
ncbi:MAG: cell surface protein SprA, partial [Muribaculaceae bacterium]|nr:cell surface protein SprA [Muribaculaceae bacterium]